MTTTRKPHVLSATRGNARPGSIIFFDTETNQVSVSSSKIKHTLRLGYAQHWRRSKRKGYYLKDDLSFADITSFWDWTDKQIRKKSTTYIVAHNIVFDIAVMHAFRELHERHWKLQSLYSKGITSIFRWKDGERRLTGVDNMNLFAGKLEHWGQIMGVPKGHVDFDNVTDADLLTYCKRDVEIMVRSWQSWLKFLDEHDLGNFKITIGSTALSAWRHKYMRHKVFIHTDPLALTLEREAYHGGRTECFWGGKREDGPYYYMDVNNMYGYVLSKFEYPAGIWSVDEHPTITRLLRKLEKQSVVARVRVCVDEPLYPMISTTYAYYPVGEFITTLTSPELIVAIQRGWLRDVYAMSWYRRAPLFAEFVQDFYAMRMKYKEEGNTGYEQIAKLMMNSLYGKFGQSGFDQHRIGDAPIDETWSRNVINAQTHKVSRMFALAGGIYEEHKSGESANSFPAIAAHVTAYARLYLYNLFTIAGRDHVYYCDTDSMIVDQSGYDHLVHLIDPTRLGYLKIEHQSQDLEIRAPKDYRMSDRIRIKGVSVDAQTVNGNTVMQSQWERLFTQIHNGETNDFVVRQVRKSLRREIRSGTILPSGWVQPFELTMQDEASLLFGQTRPFEIARRQQIF